MTEPTGPANWREVAKLTLAEFIAQAFTGEPSEEQTKWLRGVWAICGIRALHEQCRGQEFEDRAKLLSGYKKTNAHKVVTSGIADHLPEIWAKVEAEAHVAALHNVEYRYPGLNTMVGWYAEPKIKDEDLTDEEKSILEQIEPYWKRDQEARLIAAMVEEGRLLATTDQHGAPFRFVRDVSRHTREADKLILWLDPQGVDDDLTTPMEG